MSVQSSFVTFHNGIKCPILGLGTWKSAPGDVTRAVKDAIDTGYRHIDCALAYQNEKEVGKAIKEKIEEGVVKREDLFVTSKEGDEIFPLDKENKFIFSDASYVDVWKEMEKLVEKGLVKSIGVSNFNSKQMDDILAVAKIKPVTNQIECHPYLNQKKLKAYCESKGILITAYSPLGSPDRPNLSKDDVVLLQDPVVRKFAEKYKKSPAQIAIRYQIQKGNIVIPKSVIKSRIIENANAFDFELDDLDFTTLDSMETQIRYCRVDMWKDSKYYPFTIEF